MKKVLIYALLPVLLLPAGCEDVNKELFKTSEITLQADGAPQEFAFQAHAAWTADVVYADRDNAGWLRLDRTEGEAEAEAITLIISAQANTVTASRKATVTIHSNDESGKIIVTQLGKGSTGGGDLPQPGEGKAVRKVTISDPDNNDNESFAFEYDDKGRVTKVIMTDNYESNTSEEYFAMSYNGSNIIIEESLYGKPYNTYNTTLYTQGRATKVLYTGPQTGDRATYRLSYDDAGRLIREKNMDYEEHTLKYTWTDGNLVRTTYGRYSDTDFRYSEYENRSNIDLNWLLSKAYGGSGVFPLGMINVLGKPSTHYIVPDYWDEVSEPTPGWDIERPVREDLIGTTKTDTYTTTERDDAATEAEYTFDPEGDLTGINVSTPVYRITYERTSKIVLLNPERFEEIDGIKYYWEVELERGEPKETGREETEPDRTEVTIAY